MLVFDGEEELAARAGQAVSRLERWFDSLREPRGYGGPISHWWESSLVFAGPMLDWRYEGIVAGYLNLYRRTGQRVWLAKAVRAADDLAAGLQADGRFFSSSFQFGPAPGGTPHEAAADIALLEVARVLRSAGDERWEKYFQAAEHNLQEYIIGRLWNGCGFKDQPENNWLVPNKNATCLEALVLYEELAGISMEQYIAAAARVVSEAQVPTGPRAGATVHVGTHRHRLTFGIYTARCVGAFCRLQETRPCAEYRLFIERAVGYLAKLVRRNGSVMGHYADGRPIAAPLWISPSGELLRALLAARVYAAVEPAVLRPLAEILVQTQQPAGGIPTALGFECLGRTRAYSGLPEFRDIMPVAGWCDKAFRALTLVAGVPLPAGCAATEAICRWRGRRCRYYEDDLQISLKDDISGVDLYLWRKGDTYPQIMRLWR